MREVKPDRVMKQGGSPPLEYDRRADHVTRRQFRLLLILTTINTILLGGVLAGPILTPFLREQWVQYQQRREARLATQQRLAQMHQRLEQLSLDALPPETVVYTEDPEEAAELIAGDGAYVSASGRSGGGMFGRRGGLEGEGMLQAPAYMSAPAEWQQVTGLTPYLESSISGGMVYLHEHQHPAGNERIVLVTIQSTPFPNARFVRKLQASSINLETYAANPKAIPRVFELHFGDAGPQGRPARPQTGQEAAAERRFRIFAGQPDPDDPTRFTIDYELNGQRGTIDGYLNEADRVVLQPREGTILRRSDTEIGWDPSPDPPSDQRLDEEFFY